MKLVDYNIANVMKNYTIKKFKVIKVSFDVFKMHSKEILEFTPSIIIKTTYYNYYCFQTILVPLSFIPVYTSTGFI